jgi:hypothetical protein
MAPTTDTLPLFEVCFLHGEYTNCWAIFDRQRFTHWLCESEAQARKDAAFFNTLGYMPEPTEDDND